MASIINQTHYSIQAVDLYPLISSVLSLTDNTDYIIIKFRLRTHTYLSLVVYKRIDLIEWRIRNTHIPIQSPTTPKNYLLTQRLSAYFLALRTPGVNYYLETLTLLLDIINKIYSLRDSRYKIDYLNLSAMVLDCYFYYNKLDKNSIPKDVTTRLNAIIRVTATL